MQKSNRSTWIAILFLLVFLCITYLPKINHIGYYNDDWWQIYGAENFGTQRFEAMYSADRPARMYLHAPLFSLFGSEIFPYQLVGLGIRWLGAVGLLWTLSLIWKNQRKEIFLMSLLFLIYPGFLEQPNAFDYISHQFAMTFMIFSLGLSVKFIQEKSSTLRIVYFLFSSLFSLITFFLMDYYLGMEAYRWLILGYLQIKANPAKLKQNIGKYFLKILPFSLPMSLFLFWRIYLFQGSRYTTDIDRIKSEIFESPLLSLLNILRRWFMDVSDIFVSIWTEPAYNKLSDLRSSDFVYAILLATIGVGLLLFFWKTQQSRVNPDKSDKNWALEAAIIGFLGAVICLIPINIAERDVSFPTFNRFSFPSAIGVSMTTIAIISFLLKQKYQTVLYSLLIFTAIITHYTNNDYFAKRWVETQNFWQEWVWRVPGIENGSMLTGFYTAPIQEGFFVWAPANLIYQFSSPEIHFGAEVLNYDTYQEIIMSRTIKKNHRSFSFDFSYSDTLVFSKATTKSCLRFIDKNQMEISKYDDPLIALFAPYSNIEKITETSTLNQEMFTKLFGVGEPDLTWCYIYEKASLARQFGDWQEIANLHAQAREQDLRPYDHIEWFPFLQAYAYLGMEDGVNQLAPIINETPFYRYQACQIFSQKEYDPNPAILTGNQYLADTFCD
jgi:hypothetical protein